MMTKFYVGQKVLVKSDTYCPCRGATSFIGDIGFILHIGELNISVWNEKKKDWFNFSPRDLEPITETQEEITVNGVTYVRKPEPGHVWKFGDIAHERKTGDVVFVISWEPVSETVVVARKAYGDPDCPVLIPAKSLTFLRRADLSV